MIPRAPEVEAAFGLLDRALLEIEPHERNDPVGVLRRVGERAVVRGREGRDAVGLVEAEGERAGDADPVEDRKHLVRPSAHPVDVVAEVGVSIEEDAVRGHVGEDTGSDVVEDPLGAVEGLHRRSLESPCRDSEQALDERSFGNRTDPGKPVADHDRRDGHDAVAVGVGCELRRLDRRRRDMRRGEGTTVRQQHRRRAVRTGRRDVDLEREVALEPAETRRVTRLTSELSARPASAIAPTRVVSS